MNKIYRLIFNPSRGEMVPAAENARSHGKPSKLISPGVTLLAALLPAAGFAADLPGGGQIVAGNGQLNYSQNALTVTQSSQKMIVDWNSFSIAPGSQVQFIQPSATAAALNRVTGSDPSVIQGQLNANGQVFLVNPNGVLFTATSQVNVGSLVASTLAISNSDFLNGHYLFSGHSDKAVTNQGSITAAPGGVVSMIAAKIENTGSIAADGGQVLLGAGSTVTLDLGMRLKLQVDQEALDALITNGGAIRADGGFVLLTAKAASDLMATAINNTGSIRARTLSTGEKGEIYLLGDMAKNHIAVGGTLDASAPNGGEGGFIETSAASVGTTAGLNVNAGAASGKGGTWLIDPYDYTINATAAGNIKNALDNGTSVTVTTQSANASYGSGISNTANGDITVASAITKAAGGDATLTLRADRNITVNADISSTSGALNLTLSAANNAASSLGGVKIADAVTLNSNGGNIQIGGAGGNKTAAQVNGIGFALNYSDDLPSVSIGIASKVLSKGGDITINGYSSKVKAGSNDTTGVHVFGSAVIDSGRYTNPGDTSAAAGGDITITGKYVNGVGGNSNKVFGVTIDQQNGNQGQTTISASRTTGSIFVDASSTYDTLGEYALNMTTNGLAGNIYFNAYSVANLLFFLNGSLKGVTFTYSPPTSGCRDAYPNCGLLLVNSSANNSYLYATYNAVNMSTLPVYVTATATGTKVYDTTGTASGLSFSNISILDPNSSGYTSANVTGASYNTTSPNVGTYTTLTGATQDFRANNQNYVLGYKLNASYSITPATAKLSATKTYDGDANFIASRIKASGLNGETLSLNGAGPAVANSSQVADNTTNYLSSLGGMTLANGTSGTQGIASNYVLPSLASRSANNTASITPANVNVLDVGGSKVYDGNATFNANQLTMAGIVSGDDVQLGGTGTVASKNVGTYTEWASSTLALTGNQAVNYTLDGGAVQASITPAALNLLISKTYNGNAQFTGTHSYTISGMVGNESAPTITSGTLNVASPNVATYTSASSNSLVLSDTNYTLSGGTLSATINPAALAITASNVSKTYGQTLATSSTAFTSTGLQNGESIGSVTVTSTGGAATATVANSPYTIVPSAATGGTFNASNYTITYNNGVLSVTRKPLNLAASKAYDGSTSVSTGNGYTISGMVNGDPTPTITSGGLAVNQSRPGNYGSSQVAQNTLVLNNPNYTLTGGQVDVTIQGESQPVVQYVPTPIIVQPMTPLVISPSGLNYIPISTRGNASPTADAAAPAANTPASNAGTRSNNQTAERLTAIGEVRDLLGPTNVRVLDGGINNEP